MKPVSYVHPSRWPLALLACLLAGVIPGIGWLHGLAQAHLGRAGFGTMIAVNILMPLSAIAIAAAYSRFWTAILGGVLITSGWVLARLFWAEHDPLKWNLSLLLNMTGPILVVATAGYVVLGAAAVALVRNFRRVGLEDAADRCETCGYSLTGLRVGPCPECGADISRKLLPSQ